MTAYLNCAGCNKPLSGGYMPGLWVCLNEKCAEHGRQFTLRPMAKPHPWKARTWKRRAA